MTTLEDVAKKKAAEQSAEQKAAVELVRRNDQNLWMSLGVGA